MARVQRRLWGQPQAPAQDSDRTVIGKVVTLLSATGIEGRTVLEIFRVIPILDPFEAVAGHVIGPVSAHALGIGIDRRGMPNVLAIVSLLRVELMAPWIMVAAVGPFGRTLPFRFGRQAFAFPLAERDRVRPAHAHDWLIDFAESRII